MAPPPPFASARALFGGEAGGGGLRSPRRAEVRLSKEHGPPMLNSFSEEKGEQPNFAALELGCGAKGWAAVVGSAGAVPCLVGRH